VSELVVDTGGSLTRLGGEEVRYVQAVAGGITLSKNPRCAHRVGFLSRLIGGWYLYADDPATANLEVDGTLVTAQATPLPATHIRMRRSPHAGRAHREGMTLVEAVRAACPTYDALEQVLAAKCDVELRDLPGPREMSKLADQIVAYAERYQWLPDLASAVGWAGPGGADGDEPADVQVLDESVLNRPAGFIEADNFGHKLVEHTQRVCRIDVETRHGPVHGTGFLIGPDLVMTNYHVLADVLTGAAPPDGVRFQFGYRMVGDLLEKGRQAGLATHWHLASSPPVRPGTKKKVPTDGLDFAVVRLDAPVGHDPDVTVFGGTRGWIPLPVTASVPTAGDKLLILQHPAGSPIKMAMDPLGIVTVDRKGRRMTHRVNTLNGSSGAPCLSFDFKLMGLHRAGFDESRNEAVPIAAIVRHLNSQGRRHLLNI
jgi:hypothetical protein